MSRLLLITFYCLMLAACGQQPARRAELYDRINQEMEAAARSKAGKEAVAQAMLPPLLPEPSLPPKSEGRFNLAVNNASVTQVLTALVRDTQYNVIFSPEVDGLVSLTMKNTTVFEVLDTLRDVYGYDFKLTGKRIHVYPKTIQTRFFKVNYLAGRRQGTSETRVTGSSPTTATPSNSNSGNNNAAGANPAQNAPGGSQGTGQSNTIRRNSVQVETSSNNEAFWSDIEKAIGAIFTAAEGRSVVINPVSGVVLVKATPNELRAVENYLKATQLIVERQVMLEAKIVEVELSDSYQTGINWAKFGGVANRFAFGMMAPASVLGASGSLVGRAAGLSASNGTTSLSVSPGSGGSAATGGTGQGLFGLAFQSNDFAALLSFLEGQGEVQVLSSPRIATTNNQKAVLKVGTDDYYVTNVSTTVTSTTTGNVVTPNISLLPFFSGISLDVTPQIDDDGNIILHIHPSVSEVSEKTKSLIIGSESYQLPLASSMINESDTVVRVPDGSVVAIGGLMRQKQDNSRYGLPGVSGASGLGILLGQKSAASSKRELIILLRSTVIQGENSWQGLATEAQERLQGFDPRPVRNIQLQ